MVTWGSSILRNLHVLPLDTHNWTDMLSNIECQRSSPGPSGHCTLKWKSSLVHSTIDLGPAKSWNMYDIAWVRVQLIWFTKRTIHGLLWISMDFADSWHKIKQSEMRTHSFKSKNTTVLRLQETGVVSEHLKEKNLQSLWPSPRIDFGWTCLKHVQISDTARKKRPM